MLLAALGDIHGRFERVEGWLESLARAHGRPVDLALAVGDLETFDAEAQSLRKRTKRAGAAEFGAYARGARRLPCPLAFVGGNNEDFAALHGMPQGGELAPDVRYLGRAGATELAGLRTAFLSGIHAPTSFDLPLRAPTNLDLARRAGHFRRGEVEQVTQLTGHVELLLLHDWPRGLIRGGEGPRPRPPAYWGNTVATELIHALRPSWVLCGHQHRAWAATLGHSRVACLDQAEAPERSVLWLEASAGRITRVGWGVGAEAAWSTGAPWSPRCVPG